MSGPKTVPPAAIPPEVESSEAFALMKWCQQSWTSHQRKLWKPAEINDLRDEIPGYNITALQGRGAMGAVYRAEAANGDIVAIKILPGEFVNDENFVLRFRQESAALAKVRHPGVVNLLASGVSTNGLPYYIMDFVDGPTLQQGMERQRENPMQVLRSIEQLAEALCHSHQQGVIHRDVKPSNILMADDGRLLLADFGLARPFVTSSSFLSLTRTGIGMGTPDYSAPEQLKGLPQSDARVDIYSLAAVACEMLTGLIPRSFLALKHRKTSAGPAIDAVLLKALQPDPDLRQRTMAEFLEEWRSAGKPESRHKARLVWLTGTTLSAALFSYLLVKKPFSDTSVKTSRTLAEVTASHAEQLILSMQSPHAPGILPAFSAPPPQDAASLRALAPQALAKAMEDAWLMGVRAQDRQDILWEPLARRFDDPSSAWAFHLAAALGAQRDHDWNFAFRNGGACASLPTTSHSLPLVDAFVKIQGRLLAAAGSLKVQEPEECRSSLTAIPELFSKIPPHPSYDLFIHSLDLQRRILSAEYFIFIGDFPSAEQDLRAAEEKAYKLQAGNQPAILLQKARILTAKTKLAVSQNKEPLIPALLLKMHNAWLDYVGPENRYDPEKAARLLDMADQMAQLIQYYLAGSRRITIPAPGNILEDFARQLSHYRDSDETRFDPFFLLENQFRCYDAILKKDDSAVRKYIKSIAESVGEHGSRFWYLEVVHDLIVCSCHNGIAGDWQDWQLYLETLKSGNTRNNWLRVQAALLMAQADSTDQTITSGERARLYSKAFDIWAVFGNRQEVPSDWPAWLTCAESMTPDNESNRHIELILRDIQPEHLSPGVFVRIARLAIAANARKPCPDLLSTIQTLYNQTDGSMIGYPIVDGVLRDLKTLREAGHSLTPAGK